MEVRNALLELTKAMVTTPEQVEVMEQSACHVTVYELRVAKQDVGIVIGKGGRTAHAFREILNSISAKERRRILLEIAE